MSDARTERIYSRIGSSLGKAFNIRCAELGISRPDGVEEAVKSWLAAAHPAEPIDFICKFCQAEYEIPPSNPKRAEVVKPPISQEAGQQPKVRPEAQWLLDEFIRVLDDPDERHTVEYLTSLFALRRKDRGEVK